MFIPSIIGIIADDLTGANDTALQFHKKGCGAEIILDYNNLPNKRASTAAWAVSTESRNIEPEAAAKKTYEAVKALKDGLGVEYFYKKIDSTLRGNIAAEIYAALEATEKDAAIIVPAYIQEGRITIGGFQLLKGIPIERTEAARDPHVPICDSSIPLILKKQLDEKSAKDVALIDFSTIAKGAGPITSKMNELIGEGKKLIVMDVLSTTDFEQIVLAMQKCNHNILPCGSAGLAQALGEIWVPGDKLHHIKKTLPLLPKLVLCGSATQLGALQIRKLQYDDDIENAYFINLRLSDILDGVNDAVVSRVTSNLVKDNIVTVHVGELTNELEDNESQAREKLIDEGISRDDFATKITDYLALLLQRIREEREFVLITIGGETSYKCAEALDAQHLQVVEAILPAIPLCIDSHAQFIVTKSGNLGNSTTLIEIIKYFERHEYDNVEKNSNNDG